MQAQRVKIVNADGGEYAINLAKPLASFLIVKHNVAHLYGARAEFRLKEFNVGAYAVLRERVFDLSGDVAINVAQTICDDDSKDEQDEQSGDTERRYERVAAREKAPTLSLRRLRLRAVSVTLCRNFGCGRQRLIRLRLKLCLYLSFVFWRRR